MDTTVLLICLLHLAPMLTGLSVQDLKNNMEIVKFQLGTGDGGDFGSEEFKGESACQMITTVRIEYFQDGEDTFLRCLGFTYGDQYNNCPDEKISSANTLLDFHLEGDEFIVLVSGDISKYKDIESIYFRTNKGRHIGPIGVESDFNKHQYKFSHGDNAPLLYVNGIAGSWVYSLDLAFSAKGILGFTDKSNSVADKTYSAIKGNIDDIAQIWKDDFCMLPDVAEQGCHYFTNNQNNMAARMSCDLKILLDQVNVVTTATANLQNHSPRNLLLLADYDSGKYLDEVAESKNFHNVLNQMKFGFNTVIEITAQLGGQLSDFFTSTAKFDQSIAIKDRDYIRGELAKKKTGAAEATELVNRRLDAVLRAAFYTSLGDIFVQLSKLFQVLLSHLNPFKVMFNGIDWDGIYKALKGIMETIANVMEAAALMETLGEIGKQAKVLADAFARNQGAIDGMQNMVTVLLDETDVTVIDEQAQAFIESYGAYSPAVTNQDFVKVSTLIATLATQSCDLLSRVGSLPGISGPIWDNANKNCIYLDADAAVLGSYYEDTYSLQFELINSLTSIVKGQIAVSMAARIGNIDTRIDVQTAAIGSAIVETKYQGASLSRCDILEYLAAGKRPEVCQKLLFREDDIQRLISYDGYEPSSEKTVFAYLPTLPQADSTIPTVNLTKLLKAEYQSIALPIANKEWMQKYGWVDSTNDPETAYYVKAMEMYLPGIKCNETGKKVHKVVVESESAIPTPLYAEQAPPRYAVEKTVAKYEYSEPPEICAGELQTFPVMDSESFEVKLQKPVCVVSKGEINPDAKADFTFPSLFTNWLINVRGSLCTLVEDETALNFQPLVTLRLQIKEVFVENINECWPYGSRCQKSGGTCQDRVLSYCCQQSNGDCIPG